MKICLIYLGRKNAGPVFSLEIAKVLSNGTELQCIISSEVMNKTEWYKHSFEIIEVDTYKDILTFVFSLLRIDRFIKIKRKIDKFNPDIILYPMIHTWLPIIYFATKKYKQIYVAHDPKPHKGENCYNVFVNKFMMKKSDGIVILSQRFIDYLFKMGIKKDRILVTRHGSFSYYTKFYDNIELKKDRNIIMFFGRIDKYKGIDVLLRIFEEIQKRKKNVELWIVGEGDLKPYLSKTKDNANIKIVNRYIDDCEIPEFFHIADFLILPYIEATQSGVIPLAYSFGKPVIASKVGGIPEQIVDGETGYLFDINNIYEAVEKSIYLLENEEERLKMGKNAFEYQKTQLDWEQIGKELFEFMKNLLIYKFP